jgi:hypothetical protein
MRGWRGSDDRYHSSVIFVTRVVPAKACRALLGLDGRGRPSPHNQRPSYAKSLGSDYSLAAVGFGAGIGYLIALAVEADDEHGASMTVADGLIGSEDGRVFALGCGVADALAEAAMAEFVGATEELYGTVGAVGSQYELHGAVVLVAKWQDVLPHSTASLALATAGAMVTMILPMDRRSEGNIRSRFFWDKDLRPGPTTVVFFVNCCVGCGVDKSLRSLCKALPAQRYRS